MSSQDTFGPGNRPDTAPPPGKQGKRPPLRGEEEASEKQGDGHDAPAEDTDAKTQARQYVAEVKQRLTGKKAELAGKAQQATPPAGQAISQAAARAREKQVVLAIGGSAAAGLVVGWLSGRR